jgi:hypothetical protein
MAEFQIIWSVNLEAAADLSGKQWHLVRQSAANICNQASDNTNSALAGVLMNKPNAAGRFASVAVLGISKVVAGAAITQGAILTHDASGRAITVVSGAMAFGRALAAAGAGGDIISAEIFPAVRWAGAP